MTSREAQCLDAIQRLTIGGVSPTLRELAAELQLKSPSGVLRLVRALKAQHRVSWIPGQARTLQAVENSIEPAYLHTLSDSDLRTTAAHIAGILAHRGGVQQTAVVFHRIADRLPRKVA